MKQRKGFIGMAMALMMTGIMASGAEEQPKAQTDKTSVVYPTAIFTFQERGAGVKDYGAKAADILFASLAANPALYLVDRTDLQKTLQEHELNLSGIVTPDQAVQIGKLTGAKILVTGSVIDADKTLYVIAKIIGTETSRVLGASVQGKSSDDLAPLVEQLAKQVADIITKEADKLVAKEVKMEDRIAALKKQLGDAKRPIMTINVRERHVGQATIDPAVETELTLFCKETGFEVLDKTGDAKKADITLEGEGFSEFAMRHGNLVSVKARLEVKAVDQATGKIIATDRQTTMVVDLTEQIAGKAALQKAAADIAERLLPKLVK
ncbi:MAG: CsgG/HfaB family protein [Verrucomicrobia bacterium]|nr:CsgG/HfaB family protein [Verrucomicrobiota bacterium]MBU1734047.1 CsgG/HfaB family protein [Verrucomicrobiota bacterium]MBU1857536.1 CsgG/HfaB family protein [Verrucomicrobiota bacterium]